jgi:hypothetical protein
MIYYTLNKNISSEKIINDINNLVSKFSKEDIENMVLVINIQKITNHNYDSLLPKITYNPD